MKEEQQRLLGDTPTGPQTYSPWNVQFLMMYALGMLMTVGFSVILPALFDFLTIELGVSHNWYGFAAASFSVTQTAFSPILGIWYDRRTAREVLVISLFVNVVGNIVYSLATNLWMVVLGRMLSGAGFANIGVARAVFAACPEKKVQKTCNVVMTGCVALGYAVGPFITTIFTIPAIHFRIGKYDINEYRGPGLFSGLLSFIALVLIFILLRKERKYVRKAPTVGETNLLMVALYCAVYLSITIAFSAFETNASPLLHENYSWTTRKIGLAMSLFGLCFAVPNFFYPLMIKAVTHEIILLYISFAMAIAGCGFLTYLGGEHLPYWQFFLGAVLVGLSYPIFQTTIFGLYGSFLGIGDKQGIYMGLIMLFANMGRLVGPLWAGYAFPSTNLEKGSFGSAKLYLACLGYIFVASSAFMIGYVQIQRKRKRPNFEVASAQEQDAKLLGDH